MSKTLSYLLDESEISDLRADDGQEFSMLCVDSRSVGPGALFVAVPGVSTDGHKYINDAIRRGATGIVCEAMPTDRPEGVMYAVVENTAQILGRIASRFYDEPSKSMTVVGVTGTNGKTTVATILYQLWSMVGHKTALISTIETLIGHQPVTRPDQAPTTPGALALQKLLYQARQAGCTHVVMEVSSHSMIQHRVEGVDFSGGIFTNITVDHLDYHGTFQKYLYAKQSFFDLLPSTAIALANIDDDNGPFMLQNTKAAVYYYGVSSQADFDIDIISTDITGSSITINDTAVTVPLPGVYNVYNVASAFAMADMLGAETKQLAKACHKLVAPAGRFQIINHARGAVGVIDYAHTPDALMQVLQTIRDVIGDQRIITVLGCGGNRDTSKRGPMGRIAAEYSDIAIFTSDNPRDEEPLMIIDDMKRSLYLIPESQVLVNPDREEAIKQAVSLAKPGDIVALLGKGHETYQEARGQKLPFDDCEVFRRA